ncbi:MAG: RbsD/FucU domain-containing protein [Bacteroidales bacterium]
MSRIRKVIFLVLCNIICFVSCSVDNQNETKTSIENNWKEYLKNNIELMGHRNWIVVTDMAYPLQSKAGIITLNTRTDYACVLSFVTNMLDKQPHVRANVYQDLEFKTLTNSQVPGIERVKENAQSIFDGNITYIEHEKLIAKLDKVSRTFNVIILKSNLTMPFTSTFFELDCKYWE